jgi:hypothetical protein
MIFGLGWGQCIGRALAVRQPCVSVASQLTLQELVCPRLCPQPIAPLPNSAAESDFQFFENLLPKERTLKSDEHPISVSTHIVCSFNLRAEGVIGAHRNVPWWEGELLHDHCLFSNQSMQLDGYSYQLICRKSRLKPATDRWEGPRVAAGSVVPEQ